LGDGDCAPTTTFPPLQIRKKKKGEKFWGPKKHVMVYTKTQDYTHIDTGIMWTQEEHSQ